MKIKTGKLGGLVTKLSRCENVVHLSSFAKFIKIVKIGKFEDLAENFTTEM